MGINLLIARGRAFRGSALSLSIKFNRFQKRLHHVFQFAAGWEARVPYAMNIFLSTGDNIVLGPAPQKMTLRKVPLGIRLLALQ